MNSAKGSRTSVKPRKQKLYAASAPLHSARKLVSGHLSKELRKKYGVRAVKLRKGDKVKIMRGDHKGKLGTIEEVSIKKRLIYVTGIELVRKDGTKSKVPLQPSKLQVTELELSDKYRAERFKTNVKTS